MNEIMKNVIEPESVEESVAHYGTPAFLQDRFPLTADRLAHMVLRIGDPAQQYLGYFFEKALLHECRLLVPRPIYAHDLAQLARALNTFQFNSHYFVCRSIGMVLFEYWNFMQRRNENACHCQ